MIAVLADCCCLPIYFKIILKWQTTKQCFIVGGGSRPYDVNFEGVYCSSFFEDSNFNINVSSLKTDFNFPVSDDLLYPNMPYDGIMSISANYVYSTISYLKYDFKDKTIVNCKPAYPVPSYMFDMAKQFIDLKFK